jgi:hypothetical protein
MLTRPLEVMSMPRRRVDPLELAKLAVRVVLLAPVGITRALAFALSTAVLTTTLTAFTPLFGAVTGRRQTGD